MKFTKTLAALAALATFAGANPASADEFRYTMTNNDVLTINNVTNTATFVGSTINASMASTSFAAFTGGAAPIFTAVLSSLDGTRLINGQWVTDNPLYSTTTHPQKLIMNGATANAINLWAWWGNPIIGGDYLTTIRSYTVTTTSGGNAVPEPGMVGLLALGLAGVAVARRRRRKVAAA